MMDSVIFDLDGTLWDSRDTVVAAWNRVLKDNKQIKRKITSEDFKQVMGLPFDELVEPLLPGIDKDLQGEILRKCNEMENGYLSSHGGQLYEQLENVLQTLSADYKLFIVSNCQDGYIEAFYKYHGLEKYFIDYENPGRTGLSKGGNIKLVMERNQLTSPVYVGDTEGDLVAAKEAGIPFIFASYGFGEVPGYEYRIDSLAGILETIDRTNECNV